MMDFSVHDYFAICPQVTLTDASGRYCGEPDNAGCNLCIAGRPPWPRLDIAGWRQKYAPIVTAADRVIAPSRDAADRMRRYFPAANIICASHPAKKPHPSPAPQLLQPDEPLVIAVLGTLTTHKGIQRLRACAETARGQNLPLRFVLVGHTSKPAAGGEAFVQTGPYNNDQLPGLLRGAGAEVVWFPAQWPETFSYTLSACLELGIPVIAPDLGAFAERLAGRSWSWIVPWDWDTSRMLEFLVSARRDHFIKGVGPSVPAADRRGVATGFYPAVYLSDLIDFPNAPKLE
jgi:glycosyltransferase involved in cell wall biosynthesis